MTEAKEYNLILFDLDGTLTDSKEGIINSIIYALSQFGVKEYDRDLFVSFIGGSLFDNLKEHYSLTDDQSREAVKLYRQYYFEKGVYENAVYEGMPELLEDLKNNGKSLLVATVKPTEYAKIVVEHLKLSDYFTHVFGSSMDSPTEPKAEVIRNALSSVSALSKEKAIMVGDRDADVLGARENGIDSIAVAYGYGPIEELESAGPTHLAHSVEELRRILSRNDE